MAMSSILSTDDIKKALDAFAGKEFHICAQGSLTLKTSLPTVQVQWSCKTSAMRMELLLKECSFCLITQIITEQKPVNTAEQLSG